LSDVFPNLNVVDLEVRQTVPVVSTSNPDPCSVYASPIWLLFPNQAKDEFQRLDPISAYSAVILPVVVIVVADNAPNDNVPTIETVVADNESVLVDES
jgi:hypothetical protein